MTSERTPDSLQAADDLVGNRVIMDDVDTRIHNNSSIVNVVFAS